MKILMGINATIAAGATALGALFALEPEPAQVAIDVAERRAPIAAIEEAPPAEIFVAMVGRPLFSESRAAGEIDVAVQEAQNPRLLGVVLGPGRKLAVLAAADDSIRPVREGDDAWGWKIAAIARDSVSLERAGESLTLRLGSAGSKTSAAATPGESPAPATPVFEPVEELVD